jgi:Fe2+ transport system protein FeoA
LKLDQVKKGQMLKIILMPDEKIRSQAIRFGIAEGEIVTCFEVIPSGPIILQKNRQEIAIGRRLAAQIEVEPIPARSFNPFRRWTANALSRSKQTS